MLRKLTGFLLGFVLVVLIVGMVAFNALVIWVATGPRTIDDLSPYIEQSLSAPDGRFQVKIGKTLLIWDGWKHPIDTRIGEVKVLTRDGKVFSRFPEIKIGLDVFALLTGQVLPRSLVIDKPVVRLFQDENYNITFGPQEQAEAGEDAATDERLPLADIIVPFIAHDDSGPLRRLRSVRVSNALIKVIHPEKGVFFEAHNVDFTLKRNRAGMLQIQSSGRARYEEFQTSIGARLMVDAGQPDYNAFIEFKGLAPQSLLRLFSSSTVLDPLSVSLSGSSQINISKEGEIQRVQFNIEGGDGTLNLPDLPTIKTLPWLHASGQVSNQFRDIQFDELSANISGVIVQASGTVLRNGDDVALHGTVSARDIPTEKVAGLWPVDLAPLTREWVTANITGGKVAEASVKAAIEFGDLGKPVLPRESIDANIIVDKVDIRYLPEHPEAKNVNSQIHVDGLSLDASILSADYLSGTKVDGGRVLIEDLNADNPYIKVKIEAQSPARDIVRFLGLPRLGHAAHLNLREKEVEGSVKGSADVGFYFFAPLGPDGKPVAEVPIDYDVKAQVSGVSQAGFMKKFDIANADGTLMVNNTSLDFAGKGTVNGASVTVAKVKYLFEAQDGLDTFIDAKATAPVESLPRFGYPAFSFLSGTLGVDASVKLGAQQEISKAEIDLADAAVDLKTLHWKKPAKEPGSLAITAEKKNGAVVIPSFHLKAKGVDFKGDATLAADMSYIASVNAKEIVFGNSQLDQLAYKAGDASYDIEVRGKRLDLSGHFSGNENEESDFSFEHFPAVKFKADLASLQLAQKMPISDFKGEMSCSAQRCDSANIAGVAGKAFNLRILRSPKGTRQLSLRAQDAGGFFKAFDIFDGMEGGDLTVTGNYDDAGPGKLDGRVDISSHVIKDAPVLAKILSLASLTGFFDTLQGKGIAFEKLRGNFVLQDDVFTLKDIRTHGSAMGMTLEGTVTMPKTLLDLEGTIVPSYTLNSALGKVPLVGGLLTGGKGEGIFAARYSVKGTDVNPDVSVNPLSILTPGFLRGLFDIGSSDKKEAE